MTVCVVVIGDWYVGACVYVCMQKEASLSKTAQKTMVRVYVYRGSLCVHIAGCPRSCAECVACVSACAVGVASVCAEGQRS